VSVLLDAEDLHINFGGVQAAGGISLAVESGERLAIIGPNGAGKTTFINICTGYLKPQQGRVRFRDTEITARPPRAITRLGIARSFQIPQLFAEHTVLENLLLGAAVRDRSWRPWWRLGELAQRNEMLALLGLFDLQAVAHQPIAGLPEGVRKLVDIALALALRPQLLLMDEPTSGVSSQEKFTIMDTLDRVLRERGVTAVFVEHDMEVVGRYADRVAVWSGGKIQALDTPQAVLNDPAVRAEVIGL